MPASNIHEPEGMPLDLCCNGLEHQSKHAALDSHLQLATATHPSIPSISKPPCEQLKLDETSVSFSRLWTGNIRILQSQMRPVFPSNKDKAQNAYITAALVPIFCCRENLSLGIQKVRLGVLSRSCAQLFPHPLAPLQVEMGRNT